MRYIQSSFNETIQRRITAAILGLGLMIPKPASATPPQYATFEREQRANVNMTPSDVMRIWVAYVGQGDGILIQLPERYNREGVSGLRDERVDILIDGGSNGADDADRMLNLLQELYPGDAVEIEHTVVTHHDLDHVQGLTRILDNPDIGVGHIYHNGLASFAAGKRGLPAQGRPTSAAVYEFDPGNDVIKRALGLLDDDGVFREKYVMDDLAELQRASDNGELQGVYKQLAEAVTDKSMPHAVPEFQRAFVGAPFIAELEAEQAPPGLAGLEVELLWPPPALRKYGGGWGETINGNSVTFRLRYGDFEMLFTGDHNEHSQAALLNDLTRDDRLAMLQADVLKVPHHGSKHGVRDFFDAVSPVISVASQGPQGAKSKALSGSNAWQHPANDVIEWLGGAHRVYLTELHERRFAWTEVDTAAELEAMKEHAHVLIETDGTWFRVVEIDADGSTVDAPTVAETARSDGTRWIRAQ